MSSVLFLGSLKRVKTGVDSGEKGMEEKMGVGVVGSGDEGREKEEKMMESEIARRKEEETLDPEAKSVKRLGIVSVMYNYEDRNEKSGVVNVIGYCRVSSEEQRRNGSSILAQMVILKNKCKGNGRNLVCICIDNGLSGSLAYTERPGLNKAIGMAYRGDVISMVDTSRFSRHTRHALDIFEDVFLERGILLEVGEISGDVGANGALNLTMMLGFATQQRVLGAEKTKATLQVMSTKGILPKKPSYGWKVEGTRNGGGGGERMGGLKHVEDEKEQEGIRFIMGLVREKVGVGKIVETLNRTENAWIPKRGKKGWYDSKVRQIIAQNSVEDPLKWRRPKGPKKPKTPVEAPMKQDPVEEEVIAFIRELRMREPTFNVGNILSCVNAKFLPPVNVRTSKENVMWYRVGVEKLMEKGGIK